MKQMTSGWWILPGFVLGAVLIVSVALADTGEDTPRIVYMPCGSEPAFNANGIAPYGEPTDTYRQIMAEQANTDALARTARDDWKSDIASLMPGYISGDTRTIVRDPVAPGPLNPSPLPAVPLGSAAPYLIGACGLLALAAIARKKK